MRCERCKGTGFDPDPTLAETGDGACVVCYGHGEEPCHLCGGSGVDISASGETRQCPCRLAARQRYHEDA